MLDPFCGVGTTLIEASLLGFDQMIGSDIDEKAVADTEKNLNWLSREFDLQLPETTLEVCPAQELSDTLAGVIPNAGNDAGTCPPKPPDTRSFSEGCWRRWKGV